MNIKGFIFLITPKIHISKTAIVQIGKYKSIVICLKRIS